MQIYEISSTDDAQGMHGHHYFFEISPLSTLHTCPGSAKLMKCKMPTSVQQLRIYFISSLLLHNAVNGFAPCTYDKAVTSSHRRNRNPLSMVVEIGPNDDDVEPPLPGQMKISEIKSELDLRGVSYSDCFDRESLELRLNEARCTGKADPSILDQFNKANEEAAKEGKSLEIDDTMLEDALGGDGTLPGGMPPDMLQEMLSDPEVVAMLRNPKMQEVMKLTMTGGQDAFEKAMKEDGDMYELVKKLNAIMGKKNDK